MRKKITEIYRHLTKQAITHVEHLETDGHVCSMAAKKLVDNYYTNRLLKFKISYETNCDEHDVGQEAEMLLAKILDYERHLLHRMRAYGEISEEIYMRILTKIDRDEVGFASYK